MRLVPMTNTQMLSGSRLHYKPFVGAKSARSTLSIERRANVERSSRNDGSARATMGRVCGPRLGRSEALLETGRGQFPEAGAGRIGQHARSGGGVGRGFERTFRRSADRRVSGAGAGRVGVYAVEVPALG